MFNFGNAEKSCLGIKEEKNKYQEETYVVNINAQNDSHSIIAREILGKNVPVKVLDIGCGSGVIGDFFLSNDNIIIDGIEIDEIAREVALKKNKYRKIELISIEDVSISDLEDRFDRYDYIILADLLEHLCHPYDVIEKLQYLLKKEGNILISIPNISNFDITKNLINDNFNYNNTGILDTTHLRFYTLKSFAQMIDNINTNRSEKIDLELIGTTNLLPENTNENTELFKIINKNNHAKVVQYILKATFLNKNQKANNLKNILNEKSYNSYSEIEKKLDKDLNKENEKLIEKITEATKLLNDMELVIEDNQELYQENSEMYKRIITLEHKNKELYNLVKLMENSRSWKITKPMRDSKERLLNFKHRIGHVNYKLKEKLDLYTEAHNNDEDNAIEIDDIIEDRLSIDELVDMLKDYDVVSFDMFDTLVFRPFVNPTDLFELMGNIYSIESFEKNRIKAENIARKNTKKNNYEIDINDIYNELQKLCSIDKESLIEKELELEKKSCYANPYMLAVVNKLQELGKKIIVTSDMYWPSKYLKLILKNCGYKKLDNIYVSCEYQEGKGNGKIQKTISEKMPNKLIVHVGDNYISDIEGSKKAGWSTYYYKSCKSIGFENNDPIYDNSLINSITSAIRYNYLYAGDKQISKYAKYGFNYVGILVCGFLEYINQVVKEEGIDKIFFLARDTDILYNAYNKYYKKYPNDYVKISRSAMYEVMFESKIEDYIDFCFKTRAQIGKYNIKSSLIETDLEVLIPYLEEFDLTTNEILTMENFDKVKKLIYDNKKIIVKSFSSSKQAAINYFTDLTKNCNKVMAVDLGWSGTIVSLMRQFFDENLSEHPIELLGTFIGNVDSKKVNNLVDLGLFKSYAFNYNTNAHMKLKTDTYVGSTQAMIMEAIFTSNEKTLLKYDLDGFKYGESTSNEIILKEVHQGILDFVELYSKLDLPYKDRFKLHSQESFKPLREKLEDFRYNYSIFKNFKEYQDSLPRFGCERKKTTIGKIIKERGLM